ncbi:MAG: nucleotide exchange factor GrpE [Methanophagales archaeon]|nr:nucleotide exchange factor GrpE [Methanophagales archaeon]MCW3140767.1 nucleotide exchange factor GrpE [Methanophagales archaeon]
MRKEVDEIVVVPKKELDKKEELIKSLEAKAQKMKSDFSRYKERVEDKEEAIRRKAYNELARRLLSVADTLDRAMDSHEADGGCELVGKMLEGTRSNLGMTYNQLLTAIGVTPIAPLPGERFNDELHTAIETTPNSFLPDKAVVSLVRKGYMLNGELIRPAEVVISKGGELGEAEIKTETTPVLSKFMRRIESRLFKRKYKELEERERELSKNEEMLRNSVKELDAREEEFKKRMEEWRKRKEAEESKIHELEQRKEVLTAELEASKRQLGVIHEHLNAMDAKKDKMIIESIALNRYNKELLAEKEKLSNTIEEMERTKESLNAELSEIEERKRKCSEELLEIERELWKSRESVNAELREIEERKARSIKDLFKVKEELQKTKELLNSELKDKEEEELSFMVFEMPC